MLKRLTNLSLKMFTVLFPSEKPLLFTGANSTIQLASLAQASGSKRPLLVTEKFLLQLGLLDEVLEYFKNEGCEVTIFDGIIPNPTYEVIEEGIRACQKNDCDSVFAVGGGSTIDAAKVIAACYSNEVGVEQVVGLLKVKKPTLPFYTVPTTSGTGSEVTNSAVISETTTHQKKFVVDPKLIPSAAALDANMLKSLPPHITAATGMDALTHAIESYSSVNRFSDAERDAKLAIKLLLEYLPVVYEDENNPEARQLVALASFLAGYSFNKSGLGYVHAISHQISAHYNTPHGLTNAVILPKILRFNKTVCADRFANLERMLSGTSAGSDEQLADRFIARVDALGQQLNIPSGFKELEAKHFDAITSKALLEAKSFYAVPRLMNRAQCKEILASISEGVKAESPITQQLASITI
ncbi:alcohol dehydrogenase [Acaryochloris marina MBIC11017]|uniref:Alcohol dehydrogenase n=1 Tax=Acaryochloris marina (strain MBIC 11017) TaxID=329726 RepID=B0C5C9_ACAM1|nr:iron-containing alcohol dehydrogenase [Acaryochloris marina]ABW26369.1 alcohol dehydrogenase [Acaryochloris marina MBIC11017]BDM81186.1 alcohol dehydrogenase [Acaryochloris marina MBIC10699]